MQNTVSISFPIPEKISLNKSYAGMHWSKRSALKTLYHQQFLEFKNKIKIKMYPIEVTYVFEFSGTPLDVSNCALMVKMLEDGMVVNGLLKGDEPEYVASIKMISKKGPKDIITILM